MPARRWEQAVVPAQARPERAAARMRQRSRVYQRHVGIKLGCRQQGERRAWDVTPAGCPAVYSDEYAVVTALLPDEAPS
ncbi:MAG: hypothetical protein ACRDNW_08395 [Trebonia sp.]